MQEWEKELKLKRITEIDHIQKSVVDDLYSEKEKKVGEEITKSHALNVIEKAVGNGLLDKAILKEARKIVKGSKG